jgi:hypothetical protein
LTIGPRIKNHKNKKGQNSKKQKKVKSQKSEVKKQIGELVGELTHERAAAHALQDKSLYSKLMATLDRTT